MNICLFKLPIPKPEYPCYNGIRTNVLKLYPSAPPERRTPTVKERTYLAIDLKSFFASVECVERGLDPLTTNLVVADAA